MLLSEELLRAMALLGTARLADRKLEAPTDDVAKGTVDLLGMNRPPSKHCIAAAIMRLHDPQPDLPPQVVEVTDWPISDGSGPRSLFEAIPSPVRMSGSGRLQSLSLSTKAPSGG
jgi:hypothetical protein